MVFGQRLRSGAPRKTPLPLILMSLTDFQAQAPQRSQQAYPKYRVGFLEYVTFTAAQVRRTDSEKSHRGRVTKSLLRFQGLETMQI